MTHTRTHILTFHDNNMYLHDRIRDNIENTKKIKFYAKNRWVVNSTPKTITI